MERRIGAILRQARNRRAVELAEVEAATRIRLKYLRAIEAEDWDALPEGVYARGFIRTYASFLGLDGERLAEEYRREVEGASAGPAPEAPSAPRRRPRRAGRRGPARAMVAVVGVLAVAALALVLLPLRDGEEGGTTPERPGPRPAPVQAKAPKPPPEQAPTGVSVRLLANAEIWICLLDETGKRLVDGQILEAGAVEGPFRSGSFTVSFGNGEVTMFVNGEEADIAATPSPVGYSVEGSGRLTELTEAERPTCA
jgi:cytoskeleton protein RodZ